MPSDVDLNKIKIFLKIVDAGNITKAAALLQCPKSKLSRDLALLEQNLGVQLIHRTTRQFRLTEPGQIFYQRARGALQDLHEAVESISSQHTEIKGLIKLTAPEDLGIYVVTPVIDEFRRLNSHVDFEMIYTNETVDLVSKGIDIAVRIGQLKDSGLIRKKLGRIEMIVVAAPRYLDTLSSPPTLEDLKELQTIGFSPSGNRNQWVMSSAKERRVVKIKPSLMVNNFVAVRDLTVRGHGIAFVPRFFCRKEIASGELTHILRAWTGEGAPIQIVLPQQKDLPTRMRKFIDFAAKRLSEEFSRGD